MTDSSDDSHREEVRDAVKRALNSAFGAYKSEHNLVIDARRSLGGAVSDAEIRAELRRQSPGWMEITRQASTGQPAVVDDAPSAWSHQPSDPLVVFRADHWFTNAEMRRLRQSAIYPQDLMRRRYDPTRGSDFYRGGAVALTALVKLLSPHDTLERYRGLAEHVHTVINAWSGTKEQASGADSALAYVDRYAGDSVPVATIITVLRWEIACAADCFHDARRRGQ